MQLPVGCTVASRTRIDNCQIVVILTIEESLERVTQTNVNGELGAFRRQVGRGDRKQHRPDTDTGVWPITDSDDVIFVKATAQTNNERGPGSSYWIDEDQ